MLVNIIYLLSLYRVNAYSDTLLFCICISEICKPFVILSLFGDKERYLYVPENTKSIQLDNIEYTHRRNK